MGTKLIFRAGLKTIGGTIVEVIKDNDRIVFDFGVVFNGQTAEEVLPEVQGIYDGQTVFKTAVLISHLHLDHTKAMNLIHPKIPIYMSKESVKFLQTLYEINFNEFIGDRRTYTAVQTQKPFQFEAFKLTFLKVDHDVIGATAILIQTEDLTLFYSGDLRLTGYNKQNTQQMINYLKSLNYPVDVAIFEGVTVSFIEDDYQIIPTNKVQELEYERNFPKLISQSIPQAHLLLVNPYIMGLERLKSIFEYSLQVNKQVCLTAEFAYLATKYLPEYSFVILEEDKYMLHQPVIKMKALTKEFIILFDYNKKELYEKLLNKYRGNIALLQTGGEPLGEFDSRWKDLEQYISKYQGQIYPLGISGHAAPEHLLYIIEELNPNFLMPLHSFKPELVKSNKQSIKQLLPLKDYEYIFINHELEKK
ncbi:MAG: MBL fold metallo-hydrolase [Mycoplasmatales bacterium]